METEKLEEIANELSYSEILELAQMKISWADNRTNQTKHFLRAISRILTHSDILDLVQLIKESDCQEYNKFEENYLDYIQQTTDNKIILCDTMEKEMNLETFIQQQKTF